MATNADRTLVQRPPARTYEVRTRHGEAYHAEGDVIEQGDGWFTLWSDEMTVALRIPEADIRAVRSVDPYEVEQAADELPDAVLAALLLRATGIDVFASATPPDYPDWLATACRTVIQSEDARDQLRRDRERLRATLAEVLGHFPAFTLTRTPQPHRVSDRVQADDLQRWREVLASVKPTPTEPTP